ncbi:NAD(P)-dependent dehydrogenase (short-subunit alcohol dehydrogenase family) [Rhizobium sp. BK619]|nr:NAD(P)-dependent dehydrogenase (short-subunit alcohol dehydrogenase family) [Rhizobium sp. BK619]
MITGGSSGIGLAAARQLHDGGARVAIAGRSQEKLDNAVDDLGGGIVAIRADMSSLDDLNRMREELQHAFGSLDILFANAGVALGTPLATTEEETYDTIMDANVKGVFFTVQAVLPLMREGGSIILNTSWLNQVGTPGRAVLSASKAAVRSFARTMSAELIDRKIRVNAVSPGSIETPIHRERTRPRKSFAPMRSGSAHRCRSGAWAGRRRSQPPSASLPATRRAICSVRRLSSTAADRSFDHVAQRQPL